MDIHAWKDLVETALIVGGVVWGAIKVTAKFSLLDEIPQKVDELGEKIDKVDGKVENLTGQMEMIKRVSRF